MDELIFSGEKFISSKRAAKLGGYTTDYIGQLCRAEKVIGRLVGRNWYVKESSLVEHRTNYHKEKEGEKFLSPYIYEPLNYIAEKTEDRPGYHRRAVVHYEQQDRGQLHPDLQKTPSVRQNTRSEADRVVIQEIRIQKHSTPAFSHTNSIRPEISRKKTIKNSNQTDLRATQPRRPFFTNSAYFVTVAVIVFLFVISSFSLEWVSSYVYEPGGAEVAATSVQFAEWIRW